MLAFAGSQLTQAQTYTVLHSFERGQDGANPLGGLTTDSSGNLYGTASSGGSGTNCLGGCGTVFKLARRNSAWILSPLYEFNQSDGAFPEGRLTFGPDGKLYGTTGQGGSACASPGCGVVFALRPPVTFCRSVTCYWSEQVVYQFAGGNDGSTPTGDILFDAARNLFGTTYNGGPASVGTAYELTQSGGNWTESVIHAFIGTDGANPYAGVTQDTAGNLYGPTEFGGMFARGGTVFQLTNTQSGWTETVLHNFNGTDGARPLGGLLLDSSGNLYGTTSYGGQGGGGGGKVFQLSPAGGGWNFTQLWQFSGIQGPWGDLVMDSSGALYGTTTQEGANSLGSVFKLTYSGGNWVFTTVHDFNGQDGANPHGSLVLDSNGNLYGTATGGGAHGVGVVWEITP